MALRDSQPGAVAPPEMLLGALLRIPLQHVRARMLHGLHARGFTDLVPAHLTIFQYPGPDGVRPSELAARTGMSRQAVNYLLQQLERMDYLNRAGEPGAPHVTRIVLTDRGHTVLQTIRGLVADVEREWEAAIGVDEVEQLRRLLRRLHATLDP